MIERQSLELVVEPGTTAIERARLQLHERFGLSAGFGDNPRAVYAVEIVLEEWLTNVFRHGTSSPVSLLVSIDTEGIVMRFVDDGPAFDPTKRPLRQRPPSLDSAEPGGLGLFLIHHYASSWRYARENGRNVMGVTISVARP